MTWQPISTARHTGSTVRLRSRRRIQHHHVGSGEGLRRPDLSTGDGSQVDGCRQDVGAFGLRDGQQIGSLLSSRQSQSRVRGGAQSPHGPGAERGVFRSLDGGVTWQKVLTRMRTPARSISIRAGNPPRSMSTCGRSASAVERGGDSVNGGQVSSVRRRRHVAAARKVCDVVAGLGRIGSPSRRAI